MKVQNINSFSSYSYTPKFSGVYRDVYSCKCIKHRNTSWMFRPSLYECKHFYRYISDEFKDAKKVNVYNYACSLGYEAYSFILGMFANAEEKNPEKFFPIIAKDYDEIIIKATEKGVLPFGYYEANSVRLIFDNDKNKISQFVNLCGKTSEYGSFFNELDADGDCVGIPSKELTDNLKFSVADIRTDYKNIQPQNSIVLATNFWPYMNDEDRYALAENLSEQMEQNCYIKIDSFDNGTYPGRTFIPTSDLLLQNGFKLTPVANLFKK